MKINNINRTHIMDTGPPRKNREPRVFYESHIYKRVPSEMASEWPPNAFEYHTLERALFGSKVLW